MKYLFLFLLVWVSFNLRSQPKGSYYVNSSDESEYCRIRVDTINSFSSIKEADFNKAIELNPNYATVYKNRGTAKYFLGLGGCPDLKKAEALGCDVNQGFMKKVYKKILLSF